jgi:putative Ig domain-containing protein
MIRQRVGRAAARCLLAMSVMLVSVTLTNCPMGPQVPPCEADPFCGPIQIVDPPSGNLPEGVVGMAYSIVLFAIGGDGGYSWSWSAVPGSSLPPGLTIVRPHGQGLISGTPTRAGTFHVLVTVIGASPSQSVTAGYTIKIGPAPSPSPTST